MSRHRPPKQVKQHGDPPPAGLALCLPASRELRAGQLLQRFAYHLDPLDEPRLPTSAAAALAFAMLRSAKPSRVVAETVGTPGAARDLCVEHPCFSTDTSVLMIDRACLICIHRF